MPEEERIKLESQSEVILVEALNDSSAQIPTLSTPETDRIPSATTVQQESQTVSLQEQGSGDVHESQPHSSLSDIELIELAKYPFAPESDWLRACTELNHRRPDINKSPRFLSNWKHSGMVCGGIVVILALCTMWHFSPKPETNSISAPNAGRYLLDSAQFQSSEHAKRATIRLAQSIDERAWSYAKAAAYLDANEVDIANLMRGKKTSFSMQALNTMLYAMGESTLFPPKLDHKELQRTVTYFTRLISIDPQDSRAISGRAGAYETLQQYDLAIADFQRVVELEPQRPGPRNNLALAYLEDGRYEQAVQEFNNLHNLFPQYEIYQNRALVFAAMGRYEDAVDDCTKSIQMMQSQRPGPYWNRAQNYKELGKFSEAIADCKKVLEIDPTYKSASAQIASLMAVKHD
ncbi:MAG: tetratricopeptide repeat protein [Candidatus Obscuribacterales bacterium]|nr:tetratricopeptide repeat protein [Candidatus Obscuribacterales bacterium]